MTTELNIIHLDEAIVVVDKPPDLLSVPGRGPDKQDCVVLRIRQQLPEMIEQPAVHRLDMQTSGLMVLARTRKVHRNLSRQFERRQVLKRYVAILEKQIAPIAGTIVLPFRLDPDNRPRQVYDQLNGKRGVTNWRKLGDSLAGSRIEFTPLTGRTHQLRLHAAHPLGLGSAIRGDRLYGSSRPTETMKLHAAYLSFSHPTEGRTCEFFSAPPF